MLGKLLALALLVPFQVTLLNLFQVDGAGPAIVLVCLIYWANKENLRNNLILTFIGGMFLDLFTILPTGTMALSWISVIFLLEYGKTRFQNIGVILMLLAIWLATIFEYGVNYLVATQMGYFIKVSLIFNQALISLIYNSVLLMLVWFANALLGWRQMYKAEPLPS
ncbi:MAG: rod shape-determining protein MreD [Anaerolineaceae bacterium]|nr:rod shape-determining protein MreD [Anaerolineaceae bacterium]